MPEYIAPGVYVEETSSRPKSIEGVSTSTAGFVGPARFGPINVASPALASLGDYERIYEPFGGGGSALHFQDAAAAAGNAPGFLWYAVRAFFAEGGKRLYVARVFACPGGDCVLVDDTQPAARSGVLYADGHARADTAHTGGIVVRARHPGAAGNLRVRVAREAAAKGNVKAKGPRAQVTVQVSLHASDGGAAIATWSGLHVDPKQPAAASADSIFTRTDWPLVFVAPPTASSAADVLAAFGLQAAGSHIDLPLEGGHDGLRPGEQSYALGLRRLEGIDEIAVVAAPGATARRAAGAPDTGTAVTHQLVAHAAAMHYRIALLDSGEAQTLAEVRALRATLDSSYAALYYPWVTVRDRITGQPIQLPPSGFVAGIFARSDNERGVFKAPANEVVRSAVGFEVMLSNPQQAVLEPEGINCFRAFDGRGLRLWGARTVSSDPEWKYVNLRRYFAYVEHSVDRGTQWAVFEPSGEALWARVRQSIEGFLHAEWRSGALLGSKPEQACFVRCDRTTMTQNDLNNGRLVCLVGLAVVKPAEFVIFRIGQWTADRKP